MKIRKLKHWMRRRDPVCYLFGIRLKKFPHPKLTRVHSIQDLKNLYGEPHGI